MDDYISSIIRAYLVIPTTDKINNLNADLLDSMTTASANTGSTVVNRDSNGDFAANQITAASAAGAAGFLGNASTADAWKTARTFTIDGVVSGSVSVDGSSAPTITTTFVDSDITALAAQAIWDMLFAQELELMPKELSKSPHRLELLL